MNDKCNKCDFKSSCELADKGYDPHITPCQYCKYYGSGIFKKPCAYCHVFAMDGYCKFESKGTN